MKRCEVPKTPMLNDAAEVTDQICSGGMVLLVSGDTCRLVPVPRWHLHLEECHCPTVEVAAQAFRSLQPIMGALTKMGVPPPEQRKKNQGYKLGWLEMGLPDPGPGQYYLFVQ